LANEDPQELREEGWQAHDLRSGVAKVYAEAKRRNTLGIRVVAVWAVLIFIYGALDMAGLTAVAPPMWDAAAGFGAIMLSALAVSKTSAPMLGAVGLIMADLAVLAYRFAELIDHGSATDHIMMGLRIAIAPIAMFLVLNGYFGALSIEAFKMGFSPGADWRTRMNPRMMQLIVVGACMGALVLGVGSWVGAVATGFAQTNVTWAAQKLFMKPIKLKVAKNQPVKGARSEGEEDRFAELEVLKNTDPNAVPIETASLVYPESAKPITSTAGLDEFAQVEVEDAWDFGSDTDEAGCLLEGHGKQDRCRDDRCRHWSRVFTRACLVKSRKSEKFCDAVPAPTMPHSGDVWAQKLCAGRTYESCRELLYAVQGHCHPPTAKDLAKDGKPAAAPDKLAGADGAGRVAD
jgi:hypothetical protein